MREGAIYMWAQVESVHIGTNTMTSRTNYDCEKTTIPTINTSFTRAGQIWSSAPGEHQLVFDFSRSDLGWGGREGRCAVSAVRLHLKRGVDFVPLICEINFHLVSDFRECHGLSFGEGSRCNVEFDDWCYDIGSARVGLPACDNLDAWGGSDASVGIICRRPKVADCSQFAVTAPNISCEMSVSTFGREPNS